MDFGKLFDFHNASKITPPGFTLAGLFIIAALVALAF
jgi:hypothetical protein